MLVRVHHEISDLQASAGCDLGTAQQSTDTQKKLIQINGLHHIIIHAHAEAPLLRGEIVARGHEQDGDLVVQGTHGLHKLKTVDAGHHDVRNDQVKSGFIHLVVCLLRTKAPRGFVPTAIQKGTHTAIEVSVVLHNQDLKHSLSSYFILPMLLYYSIQMLRFCLRLKNKTVFLWHAVAVSYISISRPPAVWLIFAVCATKTLSFIPDGFIWYYAIGV